MAKDSYPNKDNIVVPIGLFIKLVRNNPYARKLLKTHIQKFGAPTPNEYEQVFATLPNGKPAPHFWVEGMELPAEPKQTINRQRTKAPAKDKAKAGEEEIK